MNTKNNKRRQESKKRIREAFLEFLKTKKLSEIKVSEICHRAEINRSTFYANFYSVYALADFVYGELESQVGEFFHITEDPRLWEENFLNLFTHIRDNQDLYAVYFILESERSHVLSRNLSVEGKLAAERSADYRIVFFKNGFNAMVKLWLNNGCKESPVMMRDILLYEYRDRFNN